MKYRVRGRFKMGEIWQKFDKVIEAESKEKALHIIYSLLGGNHKVNKYMIKIEGVEEIEE